MIPQHVQPMLATLIDKPFDNKNWIFEIKWDGYRTVSEITNKGVKIYSRNFKSFNQKFPQIVKELKKIKHETILDGEIVALNEKGKPEFQLLQNYQQHGKLVYYVFDILYLDGKDLTNLPLIKRKEILKPIIPQSDTIFYTDHIEEKGIKFFNLAKKEGLEGIIAKEKNSPYHVGTRSKNWLKIKRNLRQEAIICGFTKPRKSRKHFGALVLGIYKDKKLKYIGHTGGGFNEENLKETMQKLAPLIQKKSPFENPPKTNTPVQWVRPKLICEVEFSEWTKDNIMRQPIFISLKEGISTNFTNPDKIFWPKEKYTKKDLLNYYKEISSIILPYLKDRPQSLLRHPNGIKRDSFFQKNIEDKVPPFAKLIKIHSENEERDINYLLCQNKETLLYMANLGCIEINPWNSTFQNPQNPTYMIFDLDPIKISFNHVVKVANRIHEILEILEIESFCKTSGKTGLHIYAPANNKYSYEQIRNLAEIIVRIVHQKLPKTTSIERKPFNRQNKVYLDYLQNRRGQTMVAPYSLRPLEKAPISTPLKWSELKDNLDPKNFNIKTIYNRLDKIGDIFQPVLKKGFNLKTTLNKLESLGPVHTTLVKRLEKRMPGFEAGETQCTGGT